jgi:hypothetical protein
MDTSSGKRRGKYVGERDAQEGRRGIRTVIDVMLERSSFPRGPAASAHEADRIDFYEERGGAAFGRSFGIKDVRLAERQIRGVHALRMLVEQIAQIRCGIRGARQRQQHGRGTLHQADAPAPEQSCTTYMFFRQIGKSFAPRIFCVAKFYYLGSIT